MKSFGKRAWFNDGRFTFRAHFLGVAQSRPTSCRYMKLVLLCFRPKHLAPAFGSEVRILSRKAATRKSRQVGD